MIAIRRISLDEILTKKEVAEFLKVSEATIYRLTKRGELPAIRGSKRFLRYQKSDVLAFLQKLRTVSIQTEEAR